MNIKKLALPVVDENKVDWKQIVYAEVYAPNVLDTHGDYMTAETIEKMAHDFLKAKNQRNIDIMHNNVLIKACIVESYIARDDDTFFTPKSWVVGIHIEDENVWQAILKGELNGLSLEAFATPEERIVEVAIPDTVRGYTSNVKNHTHQFIARYDSQGNFIGGITDVVDGHSHDIEHATMTNISEGHSHTFDSVDGFYILGTE